MPNLQKNEVKRSNTINATVNSKKEAELSKNSTISDPGAFAELKTGNKAVEKKDNKSVARTKTFTKLNTASAKTIREVKDVKKVEPKLPAEEVKDNKSRISKKSRGSSSDFSDSLSLLEFKEAEQNAENESILDEDLQDIQILELEKPGSKEAKKKNRKQIESDIERYHNTLEEAENTIFSGYQGDALAKTKYSTVGNFKKDKRIDKAIERKKYAQAAEAFMESGEADNVEYGHINDTESLTGLVNAFMRLSGKEYPLDTDENFIKNLEKNYELTKAGRKMQKYISDAVDGGYLPGSIDLESVQKRIADFEELKQYLDIRSKIITSPYYIYCASQDVNYTDEQLAHFINGFENKDKDFKVRNKEVLDYLKNVQQLRGSKFMRKKGIKSVSGQTKPKAKHDAKVLQTKEEKRHVVKIMTKLDGDLKTRVIHNDEHYEKTFTKNKLRRSLIEIEDLKVSDLHFAGFADMTDYGEVNAEIFDKVRDIEQILFIGARNGDLDDMDPNRIMKIRAKLTAFKAMERLFESIRKEIVAHPEETVDKYTYDEIWQNAVNAIKENNEEDNTDYPKLGMDLDAYTKSILKTYKEEAKRAKEEYSQVEALIEAHIVIEQAEEETAKEISKKDRQESLFKDIEAGQIRMLAGGLKTVTGALAATFKERKLSVRDREKLLNERGSDQYKKNKIAQTLKDNSKAAGNLIYEIKNKVSLENRIKVGDKTMEDLAALMHGNFQDSQTKEDEMNTFVSLYADKDQRGEILDMVTKSIILLPMVTPEDMKVPNGQALAKNAALYEEISSKAYAYRNLLRANPEYADTLKKRFDGEKSDYSVVMEKLNRMFAYSDYYRACKLLLTDNYYILHENTELGLGKVKGLSKEARHTYDLLRLVDSCVRRLADNEYEDRTEGTQIEKTLDLYEGMNVRQAYLTGRVDLKQANVSHAQEEQKQIKKFLQKIFSGGSISDDILNYDPAQNPEAERLRTPAVDNYIMAFKTHKFFHQGAAPIGDFDVLTPRQRELVAKLRQCITGKDGKLITSISFTDGLSKDKDAEVWSIKTEARRLVTDIALGMSDQASDEELIDMMEGLVLTLRGDFKADDEASYKYARERFLRSAKKLFELEHEQMKRFENTYGTMPTDCSTPVFMHSLGSGMNEVYTRGRFGQNLTELCDEQKSTYNGVETDLGTILVGEGMISEARYQDSRKKHVDYFQLITGITDSYTSGADVIFDVEKEGSDPSDALEMFPRNLYFLENSAQKNNIGGPHLSYSKKRDFWKKAISSKDKKIYCGKNSVKFYSDMFNFYGSSEIKKIKERRQKDYDIGQKTFEYLKKRQDLLLNDTLRHMKEPGIVERFDEEQRALITKGFDNAQKAQIKKLMVFHPGMSRDYWEEAEEAQLKEFYSNVMAFLGLGVKKDQLKEAKLKAFEYFREKADELSKSVDGREPEDIMTANKVRTSKNPVLGSKLMKLENVHQMFDTLQDMAADKKDLYWFDAETKDKLKTSIFKNLRLECLRAVMMSNYYLKAKDITGRYETAVGRNFLALKALGMLKTEFRDNNLDRTVFADKELTAFMKECGIRIDSFDEEVMLKGAVTRKAEAPVAVEDLNVSLSAEEEGSVADIDEAEAEAPMTVETLNMVLGGEEEEDEYSETIGKNVPAKTRLSELDDDDDEEDDVVAVQTEEKKEKADTTTEKTEKKEKADKTESDKTGQKKEAKQAENRPVKASEIDRNKLPVMYEEAGPQLSVEKLRKIYNEQSFNERAKVLDQAGFAVPVTRDELVQLRAASNKYNKYVLLIKKDGTDSVEQTWADNADPIMAENYDWMMEYFRVNDPSLDLYMDKAKLLKPLEKKTYKVSSISLEGMNEGYESQGYQNCFCCTATAMISHMYSKKKGSDKYIKVGDQYEMRAYEPKLRKYDPSFERDASVSMIQYSKQVKDLYLYCGEGKRKAGNIFEDADYILEQLEKTDLHIQDVCVNSMKFNYPDAKMRKGEEGKVKASNQIEIFKKTIAGILEKGNVVGAYYSNPSMQHYVTITGIDGNKLTVYDSSGYKKAPQDMSIVEFFKGVTTVELNWLSEIENPQELTAEYSNLTYSNEGGFGVRELDPDTVRCVGHTKGLTVKKNFGDMGPGMDGVSQSIYIPTPQVNIETQPYEEFEPFFDMDELAEEQKAQKAQAKITGSSADQKTVEKTKEDTTEKPKEDKAEEGTYVYSAVSGSTITREEKKEEAKAESVKEEKKEEKEAKTEVIAEEKKEEKKEENKKSDPEDKMKKLETDIEDRIMELNFQYYSDTLTTESNDFEEYADEVSDLLMRKERLYRHYLKGEELNRKLKENKGRLATLKNGPVKSMSEADIKKSKKKEYTLKVTEDQKKNAKYEVSAYPELNEKSKAKNPLDANKLDEYLGEDVLTDKLEAQYVGSTTAKLAKLPEFKADPKEKAELKKTIRDHLLLEQGALIDDRRMRTKKAAQGMNDHYVDDLTSAELYGKYGAKAEYKNAVREILFVKDVFDGTNKAIDNIWMRDVLGHVVKGTVINSLESLDINTFIIADDAQFVAGFGARYDLLTKIEAYETLLDLHEEESANIRGGKDKTVARAKLEILKTIRQSYEERMKLISSPYYTALSTEYLNSFMGIDGAQKLMDEGLDASVKEYIELYRKVHGRALSSKGIDMQYNAGLNAIRRKTAAKDVERIREKYLYRVKLDGSNEEVLTQIYNNQKNAEMGEFSRDDIKFLRTQEIRLASDTLDLGGEDFMKFHADFADILTKGVFRGNVLDEKVRKKISGYIHSYVAEMKELEAAHRIREVLTQVTVFSCGADTNNPEFTKTDIGKLILRLKNCEEEETVNEIISAERSTHLVNTFGPKGVLLTIYKTLIDSGVPIGEKYAERARDPKVRQEILDIAKKANDYPPILVNGREYMTYSQPPVLMKIDGLNIKMKPADAGKLDILVKNIEQCYEDNIVNRDVYDGGGDKAILNRLVSIKTHELILSYTKELETLLKKYKIDISGEKEIPAKYKITHEEFRVRTIKGYNEGFDKAYRDKMGQVHQKLDSGKKKNKSGRYSENTRWFASMSSCMFNLKAVSEEECQHMYEVLLLDEKQCSKYELNQKAHAYESIFNQVMSFDLKSINISKISDLADSKFMDLRFTCQLMLDFHGHNFDQYEKLIDDPEVSCVLDKNQLNEVRSRHSLFQYISQLVDNIPRYCEVAIKNGLNIDEIYEKPADEIIALGVTADAQLKTFYSDMANLKIAINAVGYNPGDDIEQFLDTIRKNEYKLTDSHENIDKTLNDLKEADKHEALNLDQIYAAIDSEYADSGLSARQIQTIKDRQKDFYDYDETIRSNADPELIKALEKDESLDTAGIKYLLYPVKVNKQGNPLTKEDEINLNTNNEYLESLQSKKLSDRQEFLDYSAQEAEKLVFTYKQLNDPKYIVRHKDQAIRHLSFFRNLIKLYEAHADYYLTEDMTGLHAMLFNLLIKTDYVNYASYCIQRALLSDRMRKDGTLSGTYAEGLEAPDTFVSTYSNGKNKVGKADLTGEEFNALRAKYGSKKQSFTLNERAGLIESVLEDMKKNKGKKKY